MPSWRNSRACDAAGGAAETEAERRDADSTPPQWKNYIQIEADFFNKDKKEATEALIKSIMDKLDPIGRPSDLRDPANAGKH